MKKNKELNLLLGIYLMSILFGVLTMEACRKIPVPEMKIDLGKAPVSTAIKSISQSGTTVNAVFQTTPGAKYNVQVIPFGSYDPVFKDGFTAEDTLTVKQYNLSQLAKKNYDLIFLDIEGKEIKHPITIK